MIECEWEVEICVCITPNSNQLSPSSTSSSLCCSQSISRISWPRTQPNYYDWYVCVFVYVLRVSHFYFEEIFFFSVQWNNSNWLLESCFACQISVIILIIIDWYIIMMPYLFSFKYDQIVFHLSQWIGNAKESNFFWFSNLN